jgi:hypothetical protein
MLLFAAVQESGFGTSRTFCDVRLMSAIEGKPDIRRTTPQVGD